MNLSQLFKLKFLAASQDRSNGKWKKLESPTKKNKYLYASTCGCMYSLGCWLQADGNYSHGLPILRNYFNSKEINAVKMPSTHCNWLCQQVKISLKWIFHFRVGFLMTKVTQLCLQLLFPPFLWEKKNPNKTTSSPGMERNLKFIYTAAGNTGPKHWGHHVQNASQAEIMSRSCLNEFWVDDSTKGSRRIRSTKVWWLL